MVEWLVRLLPMPVITYGRGFESRWGQKLSDLIFSGKRHSYLYEAETPTPSDESINRGLVCVACIPSHTDLKDPDAHSKTGECQLQKHVPCMHIPRKYARKISLLIVGIKQKEQKRSLHKLIHMQTHMPTYTCKQTHKHTASSFWILDVVRVNLTLAISVHCGSLRFVVVCCGSL